MKIETQHYTIYHGDSLKLLPDIRADLILTDPPYPLTSGGNTTPCEGSVRMRGIFDGEKYDNGGNLFKDMPKWAEFMPLLYGALNTPGHCYTMAEARNVLPMLAEAEAAGFLFHNLLNWRKGTCTPNRWYMKDTEYIGFFFKGAAFNISNCSSKQSADVPHRDESQNFAQPNDDGELIGHPTEKPVMLMRHYISNSTRLGQTVLDPFMGSGSTGVAAILEGRKFIGIDKDGAYFDIARQRMDEAIRLLPEQNRELF